ncbi:hypothetical protein Hypma_003188 [Hypsizygus marmoreus]|uniref:Uncharacterized protein n=1 Tax=Hypsizygus marmoreus TaxID=39966 RepID=A0A369K240_HYPMA|nr:hypothetical protein Hypma_003188 [Hypsizygus marmoreus]
MRLALPSSPVILFCSRSLSFLSFSKPQFSGDEWSVGSGIRLPRRVYLLSRSCSRPQSVPRMSWWLVGQQFLSLRTTLDIVSNARWRRRNDSTWLATSRLVSGFVPQRSFPSFNPVKRKHPLLLITASKPRTITDPHQIRNRGTEADGML